MERHVSITMWFQEVSFLSSYFYCLDTLSYYDYHVHIYFCAQCLIVGVTALTELLILSNDKSCLILSSVCVYLLFCLIILLELPS
jgi:hypothetical protein